MTSSLNTLPVEILTQIGSNLEKCGWRVDLASCSRNLYQAILPLIYTDITLISRRHLPSLVTYLTSHTELAQRVTALTITKAWKIPWATEGSNPVLMNPHDIATASKVIEGSPTLSQPRQKKWTEALRTNDQDTYLALLLASLPNLEYLDIAVAEEPGDHVIALFSLIVSNKPLLKNQFTFSCLRTIISNCDEYEYGSSLDMFRYYISLPSLRQLHLQGVHSDDGGVAEGLKYRRHEQLEVLEFRQGRFNPEDLHNILAACPRLKTFIYEEGWSHITTCAYSIPRLELALKSCESTLERLWIDYEEDPDYASMDDLTPVKTLRNFTNLKHLRCGMFLLAGAKQEGMSDDDAMTSRLSRILPQSLQTLYIGYPEWPMALQTSAWGTEVLFELLGHLLEQMPDVLPKLRRLVVEIDSSVGSQYLEMCAKDAEVEFVRVDGKLGVDERRALGFEGRSAPGMISHPSFVPRRRYGEGGF